MTKTNLKQLPVFLLISAAVFVFGGLFQPGEWYDSLNRAPWSPPNIAFPIVWSFLYLAIALAGWQIFARGTAYLKQLWATQMVFNALWSWLFFGQHWVTLALVDLIAIWLTLLLLIAACWRQHIRLTATLLLPYLLWVSLAVSLNSYVLLNNSFN